MPRLARAFYISLFAHWCSAAGFRPRSLFGAEVLGQGLRLFGSADVGMPSPRLASGDSAALALGCRSRLQQSQNSVMSQPAVQFRAPATRARSLIVPREHGAWGILLVPLVTGTAVGLRTDSHVLPLGLFAIAALALFWLRTPIEILLGATPLRVHTSAERRTLMVAAVMLAAVAAAALAGVLWRGENLLLLAIGGVAALAFAAQAGLKRLGRSTRMTAQLVGSLGLTCTAPAAYYLATGKVDARALGLWLVNWLFAGNQIHFVQMRIHAARASGWTEKFPRARGFFFGQLAMAAGLVLAWRFGLVPPVALVAFVPVLFRGIRWFFRSTQPLNVHRLGVAELTHAIVFGILLILGFVV